MISVPSLSYAVVGVIEAIKFGDASTLRIVS